MNSDPKRAAFVTLWTKIEIYPLSTICHGAGRVPKRAKWTCPAPLEHSEHHPSQRPLAKPARVRESSREAMKRKILALGGALLVALTACSGGSHVADPPSTPPPTTAPPDPYAIPQVITVAYVNSVLAASGSRITATPPGRSRPAQQLRQAVQNLQAIYIDPVYAQPRSTRPKSASEAQSRTCDRHAGDGASRSPDSPPPPHRASSSKPGRIFQHVLIHAAPEAESEYYELVPKPASIDPDHLNPTPWAFAFNVAYMSSTQVASRCALHSYWRLNRRRRVGLRPYKLKRLLGRVALVPSSVGISSAAGTTSSRVRGRRQVLPTRPGCKTSLRPHRRRSSSTWQTGRPVHVWRWALRRV